MMGRLCFWAVLVWAVFAPGPFSYGPFLHVGRFGMGRFTALLAQHRCVQPATVLNWLYFTQSNIAHHKF